MEWIGSVSEPISFIEENIMENLKIDEICKYVCISSFYFQK